MWTVKWVGECSDGWGEDEGGEEAPPLRPVQPVQQPEVSVPEVEWAPLDPRVSSSNLPRRRKIYNTKLKEFW